MIAGKAKGMALLALKAYFSNLYLKNDGKYMSNLTLD